MFKIIRILAFLLIGSQHITAQSIAQLDTINGFRQFKFGQKPWEIKDIKQVQTKVYRKDFVREYIYTGTDIPEISNVRITRILLSFYENRLFGIRVCFDSSSTAKITDDFNKVQHDLIAQYGNGYPTPNEGQKGIASTTWKGEKVILDNVMNIKGYGYTNFINRKIYKEVMADK